MDPAAFRVWGKKMVDYVADYWESLRNRQPLPNVKPGYIWDYVPHEAPETPESWKKIMADLEQVVISPNTQWGHPHFFAYYPSSISYPAIMGDILSAGLGSIGFTWNSSPSCTELEMVVMDWLARLLKLPEYFLNFHNGPGAGMLQSTASDSTLVALLSARARASKLDGSTIFPKLVAYCSDQAHCSVERAALLGAVKMRKLPTMRCDNYALRGETLEDAIKQDIAQGLVPFFVCATIGSTTCCSIDKLEELGHVTQQSGLWLHVDAAYAGSACICPEYRHLLNGIELVDSFNFNAHKWLMVNFDASPMWFKDSRQVEQAFLVDPLYLKHENQGVVPDYRNWQVPLGRRFRSLKVWFVLRSIGVSGLQVHIRKMCDLAKEFGRLLATDSRFELFLPVTLGLACFRLKGDNETNERLLKLINDDRKIHLVPSQVDGSYFLRFAICSSETTSEDIKFAWNVITELVQKC